MSIQSLLVHEVDIEEPTVSKDLEGGVSRDTWSPVISSEPCRIQPLSASTVTEHRRMGHQISHRIYFGRDVSMSPRKRVKFGTRTFQFVGYRNTDELERLFVLDALEKDTGQAKQGGN